MYSTLYRSMRLMWPGGMETRRHLRELKRLEGLSRQELEAWQFERLQDVVCYAYEHVPYYRERYQREDIHPEDIRSLEDFQALPLGFYVERTSACFRIAYVCSMWHPTITSPEERQRAFGETVQVRIYALNKIERRFAFPGLHNESLEVATDGQETQV